MPQTNQQEKPEQATVRRVTFAKPAGWNSKKALDFSQHIVNLANIYEIYIWNPSTINH